MGFLTSGIWWGLVVTGSLTLGIYLAASMSRATGRRFLALRILGGLGTVLVFVAAIFLTGWKEALGAYLAILLMSLLTFVVFRQLFGLHFD